MPIRTITYGNVFIKIFHASPKYNFIRLPPLLFHSTTTHNLSCVPLIVCLMYCISGINHTFYLLHRFSFFMHGIRIQRNVLTKASANSMLIYIAIEIVLMSVALITSAVTRHLLNKFRKFTRYLISSCCLSCKHSGK